jgi:hypothetical protein
VIEVIIVEEGSALVGILRREGKSLLSGFDHLCIYEKSRFC